MKRVLVVTPWSGGFVDVQVGLLRDAGHDVEVMKIAVTRGPRWWVTAWAMLQGFVRGSSGSGNAKPDVVHAYSAWPAGVAGLAIAESLGRPLVVHEHLSPPERLRRLPLAVRVLEDCDRILSPSLRHAQAVSAIASQRHVEVVPNPVTVEWPSMWSSAGSSRVVCLGRLEDQKGFDRIAMASRYAEDLTFYFIGTGSQEKRLRSLVNGNAVFVKPVSHDRAMKWLRSADVVACPSRHESFGIVAAEAAALGKPVVATDVGCHAEVATEVLPQSASPCEWASAIKRATQSSRMPRRTSGSTPGAFVATMERMYDFASADE